MPPRIPILNLRHGAEGASDIPNLLPPSSRRRGIMLAHPFEEKRLNKWTPPYLVQPKYDGRRCRALCTPYSTILLSSEEHIIDYVPHINRTLQSANLGNIELDGELYAHGMLFEEISSRVARTTNPHINSSDIEYHIFDIVEHGSQLQRLSHLYHIASQLAPPIYTAPTELADSLQDIMRVYHKYLNDGYEGIIVREAWAPYQRKRSTKVLKFKPTRSDNYLIAGYSIEVDKHLQPKDGLLGRLICHSDITDALPHLGEHPPKPVHLPPGYFGVGTGFTDAQREFLWLIRHTLLGKYAHIEYQHITSSNKAPRFPVFASIIDAPGHLRCP